MSWVLKLGGSLNARPVLRDWLRLAATQGAGRVVLVPGGGAFTEQVRQAQAAWHFDDLAAHRMAILGMAQTALMLAALEPALALAGDAAAIEAQLARGRAVVWLPLDVMSDWPGVEPGWAVSADSLALWLAQQIGAAGIMLVKSCRIEPGRSFEELRAAGVLDAEFPARAAQAGLPIELLAHDEAARAARLLAAHPLSHRGADR
jgi:5-(aminomethyl)-3-furanmethanol phosphate kinase